MADYATSRWAEDVVPTWFRVMPRLGLLKIGGCCLDCALLFITSLALMACKCLPGELLWHTNLCRFESRISNREKKWPIGTELNRGGAFTAFRMQILSTLVHLVVSEFVFGAFSLPARASLVSLFR